MANIPGLREVIERVQYARTLDFIELPQKLCGILINPLRVRDIESLQAIESPFLIRRPSRPQLDLWQKENASALDAAPVELRELLVNIHGRPVPSVSDAVNFLWLLRPEYEPCILARRWFYLRRCRKLDPRKLYPAIYTFMDDAFEDISTSDRSDQRSICSLAAEFIDRFASEYGWSKSEVLDLPIRQALQLNNRINQRKYPKAFSTSTRAEMEVKQSWLDSRSGAGQGVLN